jgi:CDP-glycerol glycerophosphotransferase
VSTATVETVRRFTFAAGNAGKALALPLYGLGALISLLVPRNGNLWVFGSGSGVGEGALALLQYVRKTDPGIRVLWLARNDKDAADATALGIASVRARSPRGFWATIRARVVVVTHGFGDANRFGVRGALVVQLWHGIPYKHIHLDSPATLQIPFFSRFGAVRRLVRHAYERSTRGIGMFATASPLAAARIRTAFALGPDRVLVTGDPRDDVLVTETRDGARARVAALLGITSLPARVLLYAPTWRDGRADAAVPTAADWPRIATFLDATDSILLIRSHPHGLGDYSAGLSPRVRLLGTTLQADVTPLLPAVDILITDYSSIAFDYSLVGGEIVLLAPDVAEYSLGRGVYEPYGDFSGGTEVTTWAAAVDLLETIDKNPKDRKALRDHTAWLRDRVHAFSDGNNTKRVFEAIRARLRGEEYPPPLWSGPTLDSLAITDGDNPRLEVAGRVGDSVPVALHLAGARLVLPGVITVDGRRWSATVELVTSRWQAAQLPPPSGEYRIRISDAHDRPIELAVTGALLDPGLRAGLFRATVRAASSVEIHFRAPLTDAEVSGQKVLERSYRRSRKPLANAVFFESYFGQNVSSNPRGIDRALAAAGPSTTRYWGVADASVEVPQGAIGVIEGSAAWWRARETARLLVVNDWLRKRYRKRRGQTVLQTWHGTPLKRIALDRPGTRLFAAIATHREKARWNIMLAQNQFSADAFRSAYAFKGPIWQEGYPRDDVLLTGDAAAVRARLGIPARTKIVLYAPTWRDDRPGKVDHLDVASFSKSLGAGYVTLIRGHSRTMRPGSDIVASGVIDVTGYPDISELFLVADNLVTDYSSVMFDFSVTGKPIYFFTPDLAHYRDELRGFYFDLLADAPGPILTDPAELVRHILAPVPEEFANKYAAWRERFNPKDDGQAGERVVARMLAEGLLG